MLINLQKTAKRIIKRGREKPRHTTQHTTQHQKQRKTTVVAPTSEQVATVANFVGRAGISVVSTAGKKIGQIVKSKEPKTGIRTAEYTKFLVVDVAKFISGNRGGDYQKSKRLNEHKADLRHHRLTNVLVVHADEEGHLPKWSDASAVHHSLTKHERRAIEAAYICTEKN